MAIQSMKFDRSTFVISRSDKKSVGYRVTIENDEMFKTFTFQSSRKSLQFFRRLVEFVMDAEYQILRYSYRMWVDSEKFYVDGSGLFRIETSLHDNDAGFFQEFSVTENPDGAPRVFETVGEL